jgi:hypothetical protein
VGLPGRVIGTAAISALLAAAPAGAAGTATKWSKPATVATAAPLYTEVDPGIDARGRTGVAWWERFGPASYATCSPAGRCSAPERVAGKVDYVDLQVAATGPAHMLVQANNGLTLRSRPSPTSGRWSVRRIDPGGRIVAQPRLAVAPGGQALVAWQRGKAGPLSVESVTGPRWRRRVATRGRPAALGIDKEGNSLVVWGRPGGDGALVYAMRISARGALGPPMRLAEVDSSFPDMGDASVALLEDGRTVLTFTESELVPPDGGEAATTWLTTSPPGGAFAEREAFDGDYPSVLPAGRDRVALVWLAAQEDPVGAQFAGPAGLAPEVTLAPKAYALSAAAGTGGDVLAAWSEVPRRATEIATAYAGPGASEFAPPQRIPNVAPDRRNTDVGAVGVALRPGGSGQAVAAFTSQPDFPEDFDEPPPVVVRVAFRR